MTNSFPSERLVGKARQHWAVFILPLLPFLFCIFTIVLAFKVDNGALYLCLSGFFALLGILGFIKVLLIYLTTDLMLTNRRIVSHTGLLQRVQFEILLNQIESISITRPLMGHVFDYGSIVIVGAGGSHQSIPSLTKPERIRRAIYKLLQDQ